MPGLPDVVEVGAIIEDIIGRRTPVPTRAACIALVALLTVAAVVTAAPASLTIFHAGDGALSSGGPQGTLATVRYAWTTVDMQ